MGGFITIAFWTVFSSRPACFLPMRNMEGYFHSDQKVVGRLNTPERFKAFLAVNRQEVLKNLLPVSSKSVATMPVW